MHCAPTATQLNQLPGNVSRNRHGKLQETSEKVNQLKLESTTSTCPNPAKAKLKQSRTKKSTAQQTAHTGNTDNEKCSDGHSQKSIKRKPNWRAMKKKNPHCIKYDSASDADGASSDNTVIDGIPTAASTKNRSCLDSKIRNADVKSLSRHNEESSSALGNSKASFTASQMDAPCVSDNSEDTVIVSGVSSIYPYTGLGLYQVKPVSHMTSVLTGENVHKLCKNHVETGKNVRTLQMKNTTY